MSQSVVDEVKGLTDEELLGQLRDRLTDLRRAPEGMERLLHCDIAEILTNELESRLMERPVTHS